MLFPECRYESVVNSKDDTNTLAKFVAEEGVEFKDNILESVRQIDLPTLDRLLEKIRISSEIGVGSDVTHVLLWTLPEVGDKAVLDRLIRFYYEAPPITTSYLRQFIIDALGDFKDEKALDTIEYDLIHNQATGISLTALIKIRGPRAAQIAVNYLQAQNEKYDLANLSEDRNFYSIHDIDQLIETVGNLAEPNDETAINALKQFTTSQNKDLQNATFRALVSIDSPLLRDFFLEILKTGTAATKNHAVCALSSLQPVGLFDLLIEELKKERPDGGDEEELEITILQTLAEIGDKRAVEPVLALLYKWLSRGYFHYFVVLTVEELLGANLIPYLQAALVLVRRRC